MFHNSFELHNISIQWFKFALQSLKIGKKLMQKRLFIVCELTVFALKIKGTRRFELAINYTKK